MSARFSPLCSTAHRCRRFRSPPHAAKAVRNQSRKYFRSPAAKRPFNFHLTKKNVSLADISITTRSVATVMPTRVARRADFKCASQRPTATSGVVVWGRGAPLLFFRQTKRTIRRRSLRRAATQFPNVRMETLERRCSEGRGLSDFRKTTFGPKRSTTNRLCGFVGASQNWPKAAA